MRWLPLFRKTVIENIRDWKILIMTVAFAPFFVVLMYFYFAEATATYHIVAVNRDDGDLGAALIAWLANLRSEDAGVALVVRAEPDLGAALSSVREGSADVVLEIPTRFSEVLRASRSGTPTPPAVVKTHGDPTKVTYVMAVAFVDGLTAEYAAAFAGDPGPLRFEAATVGEASATDDFAMYVPALLALALMMLMFTAAASLIKEKDKGTLIRLRISNMTTLEWLSAVSVAQVVIGLATMALAYLMAAALGYEASGSAAAVAAVGIASSLAIIGISIIVAAWLRTIFDLMTIGCFPFFVLMFFSGGMMPVPDVRLARVGEVVVHANDILPTTHTIAALGKILNLGAGLGDVTAELAAIGGLAAAYYAVGVWLFTRRHMRVG